MEYKPFKVLIVGHHNTGKRTLVFRYVDDRFELHWSELDDWEWKNKNVTYENENYEISFMLEFPDHYKPFHEQLHQCTAIFLIYSVISLTSYEYLQEKVEQIKRYLEISDFKNVPVVLIGSKCDLEERREVSMEQGQEFANLLNIPFFELSTKYRVNSQEIVTTLLGEYAKKGGVGEQKTEKKKNLNWIKKKLYIKEMDLPPKFEEPKLTKAKSKFKKDLEKMFNKNFAVDLKLVFKDESEILVHSYILKTRSVLFQKFFGFISKANFEENKLFIDMSNKIRIKVTQFPNQLSNTKRNEEEKGMEKEIKKEKEIQIEKENENENEKEKEKEKKKEQEQEQEQEKEKEKKEIKNMEKEEKEEENKIKFVFYCDYDSEIFELFLKYLYCGKINEEFTKNKTQLTRFISLLQLFRVNNLEKLLTKKFLSTVNVNQGGEQEITQLEQFEIDILRNNIGKLINQPKTCDFQIIVTDKDNRKDNKQIFKVHSALIKSRSKYFSKLVSSNLIEKNKQFVKLENINSEAFVKVLIYLYSNKLVIASLDIAKKTNNYKIINKAMKNLFDLLMLSDYFQLPYLNYLCREHLIKNLNSFLDYLIDCLILSDRLNCQDLFEWCCWKIGENYLLLKKTKKYKSLSKELQLNILKYQWPPNEVIKHQKSLKTKFAKKMNLYGNEN
ncbi:ras-like protein [Anaeramoeba flamelloides]|uniref:small monomeric GTPase n=1 Tax=Anaeramoeba flamelloides TaxID=1746091 RepID=A0ABQ8YZX2_9EUKA|nr:ras-like protein [Anaeramoeba flamelloides]